MSVHTFVKDAIYRFIDIPPVCKGFIDTVEFQRLREIKQLGLAHYVYPSAVHTRFEHSLGVMHLSGEVIEHLRQFENITDREKELVQLASLLHDVGHVAFSHLFDHILEDEKQGETHEHRSCLVLERINDRKKLLTEKEVHIIRDMILGQYQNHDKPFLFQIVCNKVFGIDTDRLDYLQRDSYHTGMPSFQGDYLIRCLRINPRSKQLYLLRKAKFELLEMFNVRKRLLTLICRHDVVWKVETIIKRFILNFILPKYWKKDADWLILTDSFVMCKMNELCPELVTTIYTRTFGSSGIVEDKLSSLSFIDKKEIKKIVNQAFENGDEHVQKEA